VDPAGEQHGGGEQQPDHGRTAPAPLGPLGHREQHAHQRGRQAHRAGQVEPPAGAQRRLLHDDAYEHELHRPEHRSPREQPSPARLLGDDTGQRQADRASDAQRRAHQRDPAPDPRRGEHVAHDADPERDHAHRRALQRPRRDEHAHVRRDGAQRRPDRDHPERHDQHAALAVHVTEPAQHGSADRAGDQGGGDQPRDGARRGRQQPGEPRQQRDDERLHQGDGQAARGEHADDDRRA
jgi:hypothetical protein